MYTAAACCVRAARGKRGAAEQSGRPVLRKVDDSAYLWYQRRIRNMAVSPAVDTAVLTQIINEDAAYYW